jgi:hypothetical protein
VVKLTAGVITPHDQTGCYGSRLHCHWHNADEPAKGTYRTCQECGHVYQSADDLIKAWAEQWKSSGEPWAIASAENIPCCAFCAHDW